MHTENHWMRASYLLSSIGAHTKIRFTELLAPLGVQPPHYGVLRRLADVPGRTQQDIADGMRVRRSVMVGLVDELEQGGWVERRRHPTDRRANALHLTPAGKRLLVKCERAAQALDAELTAAVEPSARDTFLTQLCRLGEATGVSDGVYPAGDAAIAERQHAPQHA